MASVLFVATCLAYHPLLPWIIMCSSSRCPLLSVVACCRRLCRHDLSPFMHSRSLIPRRLRTVGILDRKSRFVGSSSKSTNCIFPFTEVRVCRSMPYLLFDVICSGSLNIIRFPLTLLLILQNCGGCWTLVIIVQTMAPRFHEARCCLQVVPHWVRSSNLCSKGRWL